MRALEVARSTLTNARASADPRENSQVFSAAIQLAQHPDKPLN